MPIKITQETSKIPNAQPLSESVKSEFLGLGLRHHYSGKLWKALRELQRAAKLRAITFESPTKAGCSSSASLISWCANSLIWGTPVAAWHSKTSLRYVKPKRKPTVSKITFIWVTFYIAQTVGHVLHSYLPSINEWLPFFLPLSSLDTVFHIKIPQREKQASNLLIKF